MDTRTIVFVASLCCAPIGFSETAPCGLLSQQQVSSVVGASAGAGSPIATTGCSWTAAGPPRVVVTVSLQSEKMFAAVKASAKTSISGIGDDAVFTGVQGFSSLWVKKGEKFLLVRIYGVPVAEAQAKLKTLAASAVSKL